MFLNKSTKKRENLEMMAKKGKKRLDNIHSAKRGDEGDKNTLADRYRYHAPKGSR